MIRPLRQRHLITFSVLLIVLPTFYLLALSVRTPPASVEQLPSLNSPLNPLPVILGKHTHTLDDAVFHVQLLADGEPAKTLQAAMSVDGDFAVPDVLLYWHNRSVQTGNPLPDGSVLLGSLHRNSQNLLPLPAAALGEYGFLLLYSLAHQTTAGSIPLEVVDKGGAL